MNRSTSEISIFVKSYWNYFLELEDEFKQTQKYVAFDLHNKKAYSIEYLKLIQAVCSEIDVVAKEVANNFDPEFKNIERPNMSHWGYVISEHMKQLSMFSVMFNDDIVVKPWEKFGYTRYPNAIGRMRYKLCPGCHKPIWWDDYNNIKHSRTSLKDNGEFNFTNANLNNMILSFAALYSLEVLYMKELAGEFGPDCEIAESQLFSSNIIPYLMELRRTRRWGAKLWN